MTATPLFHETARQLWVDGRLSRETVNRLMVPLPPSSWKQSIRETALQQHREGFGYGIEGQTPSRTTDHDARREALVKWRDERREQTRKMLRQAGITGSATLDEAARAAEMLGTAGARLDRLG